MSYYDLSKIRISKILEDNYEQILKEYQNFSYDYRDRLGFLKIDRIFKQWKGLYEFSLKVDKKQKNVFLNSYVKSNKKNFGHYELKVNDKVIWDGIILAKRKSIFNNLWYTFVGRKFFSKTLSLLNSYNEVLTVSIAKFPAQRLIPLHKGNKEIIRVHYGIKIPDGDIGFCVKGEKKRWENGKCFAFNDFFEHNGWNNTEEDRIILIVDLDRKIVLNKIYD
jgi:hypothetical protein